jgi:leucyl/phenylalanyl-tRNA---protein transferase
MNSKKSFSRKDLLKPENMILMYARGAFPMADESGKIDWYMPEVRTVISLDNFNIPRSLKKILETTDFEFSYDKNTIEVIKNCADRESTWISSGLLDAYRGLEKLGCLHSVEVYQKDKMVGGLYGVTYKGAFFGESMFSKVSQASKCALVKLVERLREKNYVVLDVQYQTEHLKMFGAKEIPFEEFAHLLLKSYKKEISFV